jgi:hypothetical protein
MLKRASQVDDNLALKAQPKTKGNGTAVVLTAFALLPEIISVIKN